MMTIAPSVRKSINQILDLELQIFEKENNNLLRVIVDIVGQSAQNIEYMVYNLKTVINFNHHVINSVYPSAQSESIDDILKGEDIVSLRTKSKAVIFTEMETLNKYFNSTIDVPSSFNSSLKSFSTTFIDVLCHRDFEEELKRFNDFLGQEKYRRYAILVKSVGNDYIEFILGNGRPLKVTRYGCFDQVKDSTLRYVLYSKIVEFILEEYKTVVNSTQCLSEFIANLIIDKIKKIDNLEFNGLKFYTAEDIGMKFRLECGNKSYTPDNFDFSVFHLDKLSNRNYSVSFVHEESDINNLDLICEKIKEKIIDLYNSRPYNAVVTFLYIKRLLSQPKPE